MLPLDMGRCGLIGSSLGSEQSTISPIQPGPQSAADEQTHFTSPSSSDHLWQEQAGGGWRRRLAATMEPKSLKSSSAAAQVKIHTGGGTGVFVIFVSIIPVNITECVSITKRTKSGDFCGSIIECLFELVSSD